jgi:hypothetical protein
MPFSRPGWSAAAGLLSWRPCCPQYYLRGIFTHLVVGAFRHLFDHSAILHGMPVLQSVPRCEASHLHAPGAL